MRKEAGVLGAQLGAARSDNDKAVKRAQRKAAAVHHHCHELATAEESARRACATAQANR